MLNYANTIDRILHNIRSVIPGWAGMQAGQTVLDVCCGTGAQVKIYSACGMLATGVDNNPEMLSLYNSISASPNLYIADARCLPFPDDSFDWVSIQFGLHEKASADRSLVIGEMCRVAKPEGFLLFTDYAVPLARNYLGLGIRIIERLAGGEHYSGFMDFMSKGGLAPLAEKAGLTTIEHRYFARNNIVVLKTSRTRYF